ncbi:MAG: hypothetical protein Q9206_002077 [Seirophora lacunosa]
MHQKSLRLAALAVFFASASCQLTGTYSVQLTAAAPIGTAGVQLSNYPQCSQDCASSGRVCPTDPNDLECQCGPDNRGNTSSCQALTCSDAEYQRAETLARDLCQPVYEANPSLELSASSAIASATAAAMSALATRNPTVLTDYPLLATFLIFSLCRPVGGLSPKRESSCRSGNMTSTGSTGGNASSPITPFTGQGSVMDVTKVGAVLSVCAAAILGVAFWL